MLSEWAQFNLIGEASSIFGVLPLLGFLFGCLLGSFANVVAYRLPLMNDQQTDFEAIEYLRERGLLKTEESSTLLNEDALPKEKMTLSYPSSSCPMCKHEIKWYENIPAISWFILKGRCSSCKNRISPSYVIVEISTGLLCAMTTFLFGATIESIALMIVILSMVSLFLIDLKHMLLFDSITLPILWLGIALNLLGFYPNVSLESSIAGAIMGYTSLWCAFWVFKFLTGKEGLGYGDFKLLALIGAWGGVLILPYVVLASALLLCVTAVICRVFNSPLLNMDGPMPFGPFLVVCGIPMMCWSLINVSGWPFV